MTEQFVTYLFREAFYTTLLVSAPMLILSLLVGLVISVFQAATSIQEFTLTFVPKIIAIFAALLRPLASASFGSAIVAWTVVVVVVTFPAAVVSGFQFPAIIGLYGAGKASANTSELVLS